MLSFLHFVMQHRADVSGSAIRMFVVNGQTRQTEFCLVRMWHLEDPRGNKHKSNPV
jgi:hypothetical protein